MFVQSHIQRVHRQSHNHQHQARNNHNNHHQHRHHQSVAAATDWSNPAIGPNPALREKSILNAANTGEQCRKTRQETGGTNKCRKLDDWHSSGPELRIGLGIGSRLELERGRSRVSSKLLGVRKSQTRSRLSAKRSDARLKLDDQRSAIKIKGLVRLLRDSDLLYVSQPIKDENVSERQQKSHLTIKCNKFINWLTLNSGSLFVENRNLIGRALRRALDLFALYLGNFIGFQWETACRLLMGEPKLIDDSSRLQPKRLQENQPINERHREDREHGARRLRSLDEFTVNSNQSHVALNNKSDLKPQSLKMMGYSFYGPQADYRQNTVASVPIQDHNVQPSLVEQTAGSGIGHHQHNHHHLPLNHPHSPLPDSRWLAANDQTIVRPSQPLVRSDLDYGRNSDHRLMAPADFTSELPRQHRFQQGTRANLLHSGTPAIVSPTDHMIGRWHTIDGSVPPSRTERRNQYQVQATADQTTGGFPIYQQSRAWVMVGANQVNKQHTSASSPRLDDGDLFGSARSQQWQPIGPVEPPQHHQHQHNHQNHRQPTPTSRQMNRFLSNDRPMNSNLFQYPSLRDSTQQERHRDHHHHTHQVNLFSTLARDRFERRLSSIISSESENCHGIPNRALIFNSSPSLSSASSVSSGLNQTRCAKHETSHSLLQPAPSLLNSFDVRRSRQLMNPLDGRRLQRQASSTTSEASFGPHGYLRSANKLTPGLERLSLERHGQPNRATDWAPNPIDPRKTQSANGRVNIKSTKSKSYSPTNSLGEISESKRANNGRAGAQITFSVDHDDHENETKVKNNSKKVSLAEGGKSKSLVHSPKDVLTAAILGKVSLAGARKRLGFKRNRGLNSLSVHRSEEIFPSDLGANLLAQQLTSTTTTTTTTGLYSLNDSHEDSNQSHGTPRQKRAKWLSRFSSESPDSKVCFVEGLGQGQIVSRQALVSPYLGDIQVSLSDRRGMLEVEVIRVRQLQPKPNAKRMPSISVKVYLMKDKKCLAKVKTAQVSHTMSPMFQQSFVFRADYKDCVLQIIVWGDYGKSDRKSLMGIVQIHLNELDISNMIIGWYKLFNAQSMVANQSIASSSKSLRQTLSTTKLTDLDSFESSPIAIK